MDLLSSVPYLRRKNKQTNQPKEKKTTKEKPNQPQTIYFLNKDLL